MPGNLVSFRVTLDNPETLSLATAGGDPIATHIVTRGGDRLFEPVEPLDADRDLVLTYTRCPGAAAELGEFAFTTDEPSNIELRRSELDVLERGVLFPERADKAIAFVRLRYTPPDARGNAAHLFEYRATVDGQPTFITNTDGVLGVEVHTLCNRHIQGFMPGMCGGLYSVPPGRHVVEVHGHMLGNAEDAPPVQLAIETRCPSDVEPAGDAGASTSNDAMDLDDVSSVGVTSSATLEGLGDAYVADADAGSVSSGSRASGCAFGQHQVAGGAGVLGLLLVLAQRRRKPE
jgi:hypothetical protein